MLIERIENNYGTEDPYVYLPYSRLLVDGTDTVYLMALLEQLLIDYKSVKEKINYLGEIEEDIILEALYAKLLYVKNAIEVEAEVLDDAIQKAEE